ncbi:MAG: hypothetical protein CVV34_00825 [Methanomicrobiales archaeon HGW-Methanomicrobiales-5]|nr:MAG: hypothetical protein CVV34_00825 [Methanomicrobiales archaeon HGW-Methanomicrobiales-5]
MTTRRAQRVSQYGAYLSVVMILLLVIMLIAIIASVLYGAMPALKKTGYFTPQVERVQIQGHEVVRVLHKGGDSFVLNTTPDSPRYFWMGIYIESNGVLERAYPAPSLSKYLFERGDILYIFRASNGYFFTNSPSYIRGSGNFSSDPYYLILRDEDQQINTVRSGPF